MVKVTLYQNRDEKQPIEFVGRDTFSVHKKLKVWMDANNGEWNEREGERPSGSDGLYVITQREGSDGPIGLVLVWDECYKEWRIDDEEQLNGEVEYASGSWAAMSAEFAELIDYFGEWEDA